jgi:hypothetical protein
MLIAAPIENAGMVNSEALPAVPNGHTFNVPATLGASRAMYAVPAVPSCATPSHDTSQVVNDGINCFDVSLPAVESMVSCDGVIVSDRVSPLIANVPADVIHCTTLALPAYSAMM